MNFLFCDLDDTLFQSGRKTPEENGLVVAARSPNGEPNGFMTQRQQRVIAALTSFATLIPVTARNVNAYNRVCLPTISYAVLDHGGVILDANGMVLQEWHARMQGEMALTKPLLDALNEQASRLIRVDGLSIVSRIIEDHGLPFYWVAKYWNDQPEHLERMQNEVVLPFVAAHAEHVWIHHNGNNLAVLPRTLQKQHAVRFLIERLRREHGADIISWGMGDSESDVPFMLECDYHLAPIGSQISRMLAGARP